MQKQQYFYAIENSKFYYIQMPPNSYKEAFVSNK